MKKLINAKRTLLALAALTVSAGITSNSMAIPLVWVDGPQAGQVFTGGAIQIKAINYDTGTLYNAQTVGTAQGFGANGTGTQTVAGGEATLNSIGGRAIQNGQGSEDTWGLLKITEIDATASNGTLHAVYAATSSSFELTGLFWAERDFYLSQVSAGSGFAPQGQVIDGTNLRVDIYSDTAKDFNQTAGPSPSHPGNLYTTVTNGNLELSLLSTAGFINANGTLGGAATEFESNTANVGYSALNVIGGASASQFDTNRIGFGGSSGAAFAPGVAGQASTDIWFSFTSTQGVNGWDITSNDPMLASIAGAPDGASTVLMLGLGLAALAVAGRRRRQGV